MKNKIKKGFTLAESLIVLAVLGVVASLILPTLSTNYKQNYYRTGLKKAVNTLNSAISMNITNGERSPYYSSNLFTYIQKNTDVTKTSSNTNYDSIYTKDGMRFDFPKKTSGITELNNLKLKNKTATYNLSYKLNGCGSYGLDVSAPSRAKNVQPCVIVVDVNGDKVPNELSTTSHEAKAMEEVKDKFLILITADEAIPYGVLAQKIFYGEE